MLDWEKSWSLVSDLMIAMDMMAMQFLDFCQLDIEVFPSDSRRANGGYKEAEAGGEFNREGRAQNVNDVQFDRVVGNGVGDISGQCGIEVE